MTSQPKKRRLPRFGLKSLFALVLLVAVYFGSWPWLQERARQDVGEGAGKRFYADAEKQFRSKLSRLGVTGDFEIETQGTTAPAGSVVPYLLAADELDVQGGAIAGEHSRYYLWLFGWTVRLPFTTESSSNNIQIQKLIFSKLPDQEKVKSTP